MLLMVVAIPAKSLMVGNAQEAHQLPKMSVTRYAVMLRSTSILQALME